MSEQWLKNHVEFDNHPELFGTSHVVKVIIQFLWRRAKAHKPEGEFSDKFLKPSYLAHTNGISCDHCKNEIVDALQYMFDSGLLEKGENGKIIVPNWKKYQGDPTAKERKGNQRERDKKSKEDEQFTEGVTDVTVTNVTGGNEKGVTDVTGKNRETRETRETRREYKPPIVPQGGNEVLADPVPKKKRDPKTTELRDQRAIEFSVFMQTIEVNHSDLGAVILSEVVQDLGRLSNSLSDLTTFPFGSTELIGQACKWTFGESTKKKGQLNHKKSMVSFLQNWFTRHHLSEIKAGRSVSVMSGSGRLLPKLGRLRPGETESDLVDRIERDKLRDPEEIAKFRAILAGDQAKKEVPAKQQPEPQKTIQWG